MLAQPVIHSTASSIAELVSCAILTPAEVIKQNAQMVDASSKTNATVQTLRKFRSNPLALWRGYTALASRNLPFTALQFPMFERLKEYIKNQRDQQGTRTKTVLESGIITAVSAGTAGSIAAIITTPVDVVKTRIMLAAADTAVKEAEEGSASRKANNGMVDAFGNAGKKLPTRKGSMQIAREIMVESGVKGLYRGGALRAVWTMLGSGLYLGVYESGRTYLANRRGGRIKEDDLL
jgi:solute carrier family 25 S-adenosylmethionine transporter 26